MKTVTYAKLHGGDAFLPGIGGLTATLPPTNKTINLKMYLANDSDSFLTLEADFKGTKVYGAVPLANVQVMTFVQDSSSGT